MVSEYQEKYPAYFHSVCTLQVMSVTSLMSFRSDYVANEVTQRPPKVTKLYVPPDGRMRHSSTYVRDYPTHPVQKHIVTKPDGYHPPTVKMVAQSLYKGTVCASSGMQPKEKAVYRPTSAPLNGVSTYRQDSLGLPAKPVKPFRAKVAWENSPAIFQGTTEFHDQYKSWPLQPKHRHHAQGTMVGLPTAHADHVGQLMAPLQTRSTMKEHYHAWDMLRPRPTLHKDELEKPMGAFAKTTTFHSAYTPKTTVCRPTYTPKEIPSCPAWDGCTPGFEYSSMGAGGHRLYRTISIQETGPSQLLFLSQYQIISG
uniref:Uncharacterized protein n=1 Tax=Oncorhynchus kisutch TaxID=8019 RepID=A0A8C7DL79_ONCKI